MGTGRLRTSTSAKGRTVMTDHDNGRGAAEEDTGVPETTEEHNEPASPSSTPGGEPSRADGDAEERAGVDE
jgi:hypothetical protein